MSFFNDLLGAVTAGFGHDSSTGGALAKEILQRIQQQEGGGLSGLIGRPQQPGAGQHRPVVGRNRS